MVKPEPAPAPNPDTLIVSPLTSTSDFGHIDPAAAKVLNVAVGPIRLPTGVPSARGFGYEHIANNPGRIRDIKARGYSNALDFVADVALNWTSAYFGQSGKLLLVKPIPGFGLTIVVQHRGASWNVVTGLPYRMPPGAPAYGRVVAV